jgi:putative acetyltransferase
VQVRRTTTDDPAFRVLVAALDAELRATYGELQTQYAPHNNVDTIDTAVVAYDGFAPVGCGCFRRKDARTVELKRMFVAPAVRGRRVAAEIVAALEAWARELGHDTAVLETGTLQIAAIAAYARCGYARIPSFGPYADMPASVCMGKTL